MFVMFRWMWLVFSLCGIFFVDSSISVMFFVLFIWLVYLCLLFDCDRCMLCVVN